MLTPLFLAVLSWGNSELPQPATYFQSNLLEFAPQNAPHDRVSGRYPKVLDFLLGKILAWNPKGQSEDISPVCRYDTWRFQLWKLESTRERARFVSHLLETCPDLQSGYTNEPANVIRALSMGEKPATLPQVHRVQVHFPNKIRLKGLFAFKGDLHRRPLVIVRLGVFGNVEDFYGERFLYYQIFEQSSANVLFLENMTSAEFIANNSQQSLGGLDEGAQNIYLAKSLARPGEPINKIISSIHLLGQSFGGHGVFLASLLNEINHRPIRSFTNICPVVHLKPTMEGLIKSGLEGLALDFWISRRMAGYSEKHTDFQFSWSSFLFSIWSGDSFQKTLYSYVVDHFHGPLFSEGVEGLPTDKNFWKANDFWNEKSGNTLSNIFVVASHHDRLVPFSINGKWIQDNQSRLSNDLGFVEFKESHHCTLPSAYDWPSIVNILQSQIRATGYDFPKSTITKNLSLKVAETKSCQSPRVLVEGITSNDNLFQFSGYLACYKGRTLPISWEVLSTELDEGLPLQPDAADLRRLQRWFQQNLKWELNSDAGKLQLAWDIASSL